MPRPLTFMDDEDNERRWLPGEPVSAADAFQEFVDRHRGGDNTSFYIEDEENDEGLMLMFDHGFVCRIREASKETPCTEYRLVSRGRDYRTQVARFVDGGFAALDRHGPWWPDVAGVARERIRSDFDSSVLRWRHPRELRRRLEILAHVDGRRPATTGGVTHLGFGDGDGATVNAWFTSEGRGLVVTFDRTSALHCSDDPSAQAALYEGVPADLLALVTDAPETGTTLHVPRPGGGTLVAATGIFHLSGPCAMSEGLVARLQERRMGIEDTGIDRLLRKLLVAADFTPETVVETVDWWSAEAVARGFDAAGLDLEPSTDVPLDAAAIDHFCRVWADSGYNDRWDVHYVLFDGRTREEVGEARNALLRSVRTLGLEHVDAPPGAADGEVWVRTDPRVDAALTHWA
ncbi:hypothetical protein LX16_5077 [Stackebrandtia albiflava]|uniref:Uncharacterized protein n=1 Tax=Stackebrandtia albiflava TaxID=406432 RepID=A0A562UPP4_9ACTN|nr:DUF6357 family protein [Stackebrandtia albiflava]TWJ07591.1 hypothetical protein LX16_5077 [Stackebrandtia albiflava]